MKFKSVDERGNYLKAKMCPKTQKRQLIRLASFALVAGAGLNFGRTVFVVRQLSNVISDPKL